jgi:hypothetical protein
MALVRQLTANQYNTSRNEVRTYWDDHGSSTP